LQTLNEALETRFAEVNKRIDEATNQHKVTGRADKRRWKLIYPTVQEAYPQLGLKCQPFQGGCGQHRGPLRTGLLRGAGFPVGGQVQSQQRR